MSRTFRRKNVKPDRYITYDRVYLTPDSWVSFWKRKEGKDLKKALAEFHSDAYGVSYSATGKGPGFWFRNHFQRKYRRVSSSIIHKYLKGQVCDVVIRDKPRLPYWD